MRLIDADALIEKMDDKYSLGKIGRRERDDVVNALEFEPTIQPEPHWISCKKELPKLDSRCVLLYSNYNISGGYYRGNRTFDVDYGDEDVNTMVIAWMPKPDSYQPKNEVTR